MKIDRQQHNAITALDKELLVAATAGSGKTTTLVARVEELKSRGVAPESMVAITFTNAAARELSKRLGVNQIGFIGTLHALCLRILNQTRTFSVIDEEQAEEVMRRSLDRLKSKVSMKAAMEARRELPTSAKTLREIEVVLKDYRWNLRASGALDFDMVLSEGFRVIEANSGFIKINGVICKALFVDEYQDSGEMDAKIYRRIHADYKYFVGDLQQAIYSFRGGRVRNIIELSHVTPTLRIETNYRSDKKIIDAANNLMRACQHRIIEKTIAASDKPGVVEVIECNSDRAEAMKIAEMIGSFLNSGHLPEEIAVLARTNAIAGNISKTLAGEGIPVKCKKKMDYPRDWKLAKYALGAAAHPADEGAVYWYIRGKEGKDFANDLQSKCSREQVALATKYPIPAIKAGESYLNVIAKMGVSIHSIELIQKYENDLVNPTIEDILYAISTEYETEEEGIGVVVTTIHGFKGREADIVFVAGMEDETLPGNPKRNDIEEERRICFVAITRARHRLYLTHAKRRTTEWEGVKELHPSRFLAECGL